MSNFLSTQPLVVGSPQSLRTDHTSQACDNQTVGFNKNVVSIMFLSKEIAVVKKLFIKKKMIGPVGWFQVNRGNCFSSHKRTKIMMSSMNHKFLYIS
jgi:hypothetical protein